MSHLQKVCTEALSLSLMYFRLNQFMEVFKVKCTEAPSPAPRTRQETFIIYLSYSLKFSWIGQLEIFLGLIFADSRIPKPHPDLAHTFFVG